VFRILDRYQGLWGRRLHAVRQLETFDSRGELLLAGMLFGVKRIKATHKVQLRSLRGFGEARTAN